MTENIFFVNIVIFSFWRLNCRAQVKSDKLYQKERKSAMECAFPRRCSSTGSLVMHRFVDKICKILPLLPFGDLTFDLT